MNPAPRFIVFTDLDGTLLDHHDYGYAAARPALDRLRAAEIPLILNSSKTRDEISLLRSELEIDAPFVVENGGVVCFAAASARPDRYFGPQYDDLRRIFERLREEGGYRLRGFGDLDDAAVAELTGLSLPDAGRARRRLSSEPFVWEDDPDRLPEFEARIVAAGLALTRGGRFYHLGGAAADKGKALRFLMEEYHRRFPDDGLKSVALGDSPNDLSMLRAADIPVVVPAARGARLVLDRPALLASAAGPVGWNEAIQNILDGDYRLESQ